MERYQFSDEERAYLERLPMPLAVYQFAEGHVHTHILSDGFCKLFNYPDRAEAYRIMNRDVLHNTHSDDVARVEDAVRRFIAGEGRYEVIFRCRKNEATDCRIIHGLGEHIYTENGTRLAYVWFTDEGEYTEEEDNQAPALNRAFNSALHEESLLRASSYDYLTGLPSMTHFFALAEAWKAAVIGEGGKPALVYMDFNGMKDYNDSYGFAEGDRLLKEFARLLEQIFDRTNCCHISADRFAAFTYAEDVEDVLGRLFREARELNHGRSLPIRAGIHLAGAGEVPTSTACDRAKIACDAVPKSDTSAFSYYNDDMSRALKRRRYILSHIDRAIQEKWIRVYYQPIVRAVNGRVCDEEALARWIDPTEGFLSPGEFIPYLEEAGLIYKLDLYVLDQVLEKMNRQVSTGLYIVPHSINLSRSDFDACDIVEEIRRRVDASGIGRDKITIEITESVIGSDYDFMKEQVERFQSLGFAVWMDDFGSGYSSLEDLQSIHFDLLKFDMGFMRRLDEGESGKIILTELMRMATALGMDTVCEGVETEAQVRFLQEIGCSKLQGFYYCKAIPLEEIVERNRKGIQIGYENPEESAYFESVGRVNLYDLGVIASEEVNAIQHSFNTIPMGIIEVNGENARFVRSNKSYRDFLKRFFNFDAPFVGGSFSRYGDVFMRNVVRTCCEQGNRAIFDEKMPDGSVVHTFARRIGVNSVTGNIAIAIAVLSITDPSDTTTYADIARALAADYYNIYVVDLDTDQYIEYTSQVGQEELAMARRGEDFFESAKRDTMTRIYEEDRETFLTWFSKANIIQALDQQGVYTTSYRLIDTGSPMYVAMKITRMQPGSSRVIVGISIIDAQMKQKEEYDRIQKERDALARMMALSDDYLSLYIVDPETGSYVEQSASDEYETLGLAKGGDDFFRQSVEDARRAFYPEDLDGFLRDFSREKVLEQIGEKKVFQLHYRLLINGEPKPVSLKIAAFKEGNEEKLVAGVRAWKKRR